MAFQIKGNFIEKYTNTPYRAQPIAWHILIWCDTIDPISRCHHLPSIWPLATSHHNTISTCQVHDQVPGNMTRCQVIWPGVIRCQTIWDQVASSSHPTAISSCHPWNEVEIPRCNFSPIRHKMSHHLSYIRHQIYHTPNILETMH